VRTAASAEHGRASVERQRSSRSTDTRSRWTDATARRTVSGREMSPLQLYNTRTRAKQTFCASATRPSSTAAASRSLHRFPPGHRAASRRHQKPLRDVGPGRGRSRDDPMIRIAGVERRERSEGREAEDCGRRPAGFRGGGYLFGPGAARCRGRRRSPRRARRRARVRPRRAGRPSTAADARTGLACRRAVPPPVGVPHLGGLVPPLEIGVEGVVESRRSVQRLRVRGSFIACKLKLGRSPLRHRRPIAHRPVLLSSRGGGRRSKPKTPAIGGRR
jgi:hypothetical protein